MTSERYKNDSPLDTGIRMNRSRTTVVFLIILAISCVGGCTALPGGRVVESATIVYTAGSRQHTAAVEVPLAAPDVFAALVRGAVENPEIEITNRNDETMLIEVVSDTRQLTGQVTAFGADRSLLYVWADAGASGQTGRELALEVIEKTCDDLGVSYELVSY
jgi:hypothetical protein